MNGKHVLRLTHEGVLESRYKPFNVIRNSVIDSLTGSVHLEQSRGWYRAGDDFFCVDLTLHQPSETGVLPMTVTRQSVDVEGYIPVKGTMTFDEYWDISDEEYARCLLVEYYDRYNLIIRFNRLVAKLAIDAWLSMV